MSMVFYFPLMPRIYTALRQEDLLHDHRHHRSNPIDSRNLAMGPLEEDELTLEMVTNDECDHMYLAYSTDLRMCVNLGIRRRLAPLVDNNRRRIELLNSLLLSFPGRPILYNGDEIGMDGNIYFRCNGVRTLMRWNADRNARLCSANPARLYSPLIMIPPWGYEAVDVEAQHGDPSSLLNWMRNTIVLRKLFGVFGDGSMKFFDPANRRILAYMRQYRDERVLCGANLSRFACRPRMLEGGHHSGGDARVPHVSAHRASPLSAYSGSLQFPVARTSAKASASGGNYEFRRRGTPERNRRLGRHVRRGSLRAPGICQFSRVSSEATLVRREVSPHPINANS